MAKLTLRTLETNDSLVQPEDFSESVMSSPALELLSDFKVTQPAIIDAKTNATNALEMMRHEHSHLKVVINEDHEMVGIIHFDHLSEESIIKKIANGANRAEIYVADLMITRNKLKSFKFEDLKNATIADVARTLKQNGEPYCLVVDNSHQIRGVFSAENISKRLHTTLNVYKTPTVLNIFDVA